MACRVILTPQAIADAHAAVEYIQQVAPSRAASWLAGLTEAVHSLEEMPRRCATAPEAELLGVELRQLLYGRRPGVYRIIFRIYSTPDGAEEVRVLAIRHGARVSLSAEELEEPAEEAE